MSRRFLTGLGHPASPAHPVVPGHAAHVGGGERIHCPCPANQIRRAAPGRRAAASAAIAAVLAVGAVSAAGCGGGGTAADGSLLDRVQSHPTDQADHVLEEVGYPTRPPTGGDHFPYWQNCHFYTSPLIDEVAVHSLEHGAVWVAFRPDADPEMLASIRSRVDSESHLLASPYPGLGSPLVLSAWERQLTVQDWGDPAVEAFLDRYLGRRSPTAPEAGALCSEAIGTPDDPADLYEEAAEQVRRARES